MALQSAGRAARAVATGAPEFALALGRADELSQLRRHLAGVCLIPGRVGRAQSEAWAAVGERFGPPRWTRLYFGQEFCERRIPSASEVRRAYEAAREAGLAFSLLTGYVSDAGLDRVRLAVDALATLTDPDIEVVANDWGVVRLARRSYPGFHVVLGRQMNRLLRDPRLLPHVVRARPPGDLLAALRQSSVTVPLYRAFLARLGIARIEFDHLYQGLDMDFRALGLAASLYLPYGYVATGRACLIGSLELADAQAFDLDAPCQRECLRYTLHLRPAAWPPGPPQPEIVVRGNTFFYAQDRSLIRAAADLVARSGIDRIVYQPDLPL